MTCDERLEALLNRAGQTISDLPKRSDDPDDLLPYFGKQRLIARDTALRWLRLSRNELGLVDEARAMCIYILHLTDIIDRMETALDTALNERDYTRAKCCYLCQLLDEINREPCEECGIPNVPEDWRKDHELQL